MLSSSFESFQCVLFGGHLKLFRVPGAQRDGLEDQIQRLEWGLMHGARAHPSPGSLSNCTIYMTGGVEVLHCPRVPNLKGLHVRTASCVGTVLLAYIKASGAF